MTARQGSRTVFPRILPLNMKTISAHRRPGKSTGNSLNTGTTGIRIMTMDTTAATITDMMTAMIKVMAMTMTITMDIAMDMTTSMMTVMPKAMTIIATVIRTMDMGRSRKRWNSKPAFTSIINTGQTGIPTRPAKKRKSAAVCSN